MPYAKVFTSPSELNTKSVAHKHLLAVKTIKAGKRFNLIAKRSTSGLSPMPYWRMLGLTAAKNYQPDDVIEQ